MTDLPIAVIEADPKERTRIAMLLGEVAEGTAYPSLASFDEAWVAGESCLLILGPSCGDAAGLSEVERLQRQRGGLASVLVVHNLSTETLQQALRSGVRDVVLSDDPIHLQEAVKRIAETFVMSQPQGPAGGVRTGPDPLSARVAAGQVLTVFSTKGGAGKSVVACNLALVLAKRSDMPVVLVDGDLQFGDVAVMMKMAPQHTIVDVVSNAHRLDIPLLQSLLVRHSSGLLILPAPIDPAFVDQVTAATLLQIIDLLRQFCGFIVIDTPAQFSETNLAILEQSDAILLIAGMDIPNIKNVKLGLQTLRLLNTPMDRVHLILNRANSKVRLDVAEVERTLQMKAETLIPSDIVVPQSVNKGVPAVIDAPKSGVARAIEGLADKFLAGSGSRKKR
jgi:pilus assembly protein CpaE